MIRNLNSWSTMKAMGNLPSPMGDPDGRCDLVRYPASAFIMCEEPDVVLPPSPVPVGEVLLDPALCFEDHNGSMGNTLDCDEGDGWHGIGRWGISSVSEVRLHSHKAILTGLGEDAHRVPVVRTRGSQPSHGWDK